MGLNSKSFLSNSDISSKVVNEQQKFKLKNVVCWVKENKKEAIPRFAGIIVAVGILVSYLQILCPIQVYEDLPLCFFLRVL